jgi:hypothetical protein
MCVKNEAAMQPHKNIEIDSFNAPATKPPIPPAPEEEERAGLNILETTTQAFNEQQSNPHYWITTRGNSIQ